MRNLLEGFFISFILIIFRYYLTQNLKAKRKEEKLTKAITCLTISYIGMMNKEGLLDESQKDLLRELLGTPEKMSAFPYAYKGSLDEGILFYRKQAGDEIYTLGAFEQLKYQLNQRFPKFKLILSNFDGEVIVETSYDDQNNPIIIVDSVDHYFVYNLVNKDDLLSAEQKAILSKIIIEY